ncbi:Ig domain-containing protein [Paenibacillus thermoaerophilus]|uniref:Ig domain-containing protein n=1 Tax=Paenibacillus thermoaerophilus TaxID=1215385 RepID=A0ABW2UZX3_9BACL|nr:Ig-like domain-containing protein [Paenibacillus thermoaerophilus]
MTASPKSFTLDIGKQQQITLLATFADGREELVTDKAVWTVSNEEIAEVDKGLVTGLAYGKASVTAKYGTRSATVTAEIGSVKKLTASPSLLILQNGESKQIELTAESSSGDKTVVTNDAEWSTSNAKIADVADGLVTARGNGTATITAKYGGKTATVTVHINVVDKLEADKRTLSLKSGDKATLKLTAALGDGSVKDVTAEAEWSSSSYKVADVSGGVVTAVGYGTARITAKYGNKSVTVTVDVDTLKYLQTDVVVLTVKAGSKTTVKATATYMDGTERDVSVPAVWSSSKATVADVKDGVIRAHSKGKATITVSFGGKTARIAVTVE